MPESVAMLAKAPCGRARAVPVRAAFVLALGLVGAPLAAQQVADPGTAPASAAPAGSPATADAPSPPLDRARELSSARAFAAGIADARLAGLDRTEAGPRLLLGADPRRVKGSVLVVAAAGYALGEHALDTALVVPFVEAGWDVQLVAAPLPPIGGRAAAALDPAWRRMLEARVEAAYRDIARPELPLFVVSVAAPIDVALSALDAIEGGPARLKLAGVVAVDAVRTAVSATSGRPGDDARATPAGSPEPDGEPAGEDVPAAGTDQTARPAPDDAAQAERAAERLAERLDALGVPVMLVTTEAGAPAAHRALVRALAEGGPSLRESRLPELGSRRTGLESGLVARVLGFFHHVAMPDDGGMAGAPSA